MIESATDGVRRLSAGRAMPLLLRMPFDRLVALTGWLGAITARPVASRRPGGWWPRCAVGGRHHLGRVACLEETIAVVVLAAFRWANPGLVRRCPPHAVRRSRLVEVEGPGPHRLHRRGARSRRTRQAAPVARIQPRCFSSAYLVVINR